MIPEKNLASFNLTGQDTTKVTPMIPFGRVEDFYDFTQDTVVEEKKSGETEKISVNVKKQGDTAKIQEKLAKQEKVKASETPLKDIPTETAVGAGETIEYTSSWPLPDFLFLKDTARKAFGLNSTFIDMPSEISGKGGGDSGDIYTATSVFKGHELKTINTDPLHKNMQNQDGIFSAFIAILAILSVVNTVYYKKFRKYLSAFFNIRINFQVLREERSINSQLYFLLLIASLFLSSAYLYQLVTYFGYERYIPQISDQNLFIKILTIVLGLLMIKFVVIKITGMVFNQLRLASDYIFTMIMFFNVLTIVLLPVSISIQYMDFIPAEALFSLGLVAAILVQLLFVFRIFQIGNSEPGTSAYYIFLYLCTLEILPLIVLLKVFVSFM